MESGRPNYNWHWPVPPVYQQLHVVASPSAQHPQRKQVFLFTFRPYLLNSAVKRDRRDLGDWMGPRAPGEADAVAGQVDPLVAAFDAGSGFEWQQTLPLAAVMRKYRLTAVEAPRSGGGCMGGGVPPTFATARSEQGSAFVYNLFTKDGALVFLLSPGGKTVTVACLPGFTLQSVRGAKRGGWIIEADTKPTGYSFGRETLRIDSKGDLLRRISEGR